MTALTERIRKLPPEEFARSAHAAAKLAIHTAELAGKPAPAGAVWLQGRSLEELASMQRERLGEVL